MTLQERLHKSKVQQIVATPVATNNLFALKQALAKETTLNAQKILIYGAGKVGKTRLAGTVAEVPSIKQMFLFDLENGSETLLHMGLSDEALKKVTLIKIPDVRDTPAAIETMLKAFSSKVTSNICVEHGLVNCVNCKDMPSIPFPPLRELREDSVVIVDSLSQLSLSALNAAIKLAGSTNSTYATWGKQGAFLEDFCTMIQACKCNVICITHEQIYEDAKTGKEYIVPNMGTKNFSRRVARFFGTVIFQSIESKSFKAGSTPTYKLDTVAGSRRDFKFEANKGATLVELFKL